MHQQVQEAAAVPQHHLPQKAAPHRIPVRKKVIKAVTSGTLAPYFYVNDDNELTGVDIDIVKEVFNRLPQYELKIEQADALQGVLSGQYDIAVNNYGYTDERAESYYFSLPYKTSFNEYIQRTGDEPLTSLTDLADRGYKIELSAGSLTANALEKWNTDNPDHQINIVYSNANFQVRYQHIVDGTADVAIDDGPIIDNLLPQFGLEGQLEANEIDEETEDSCSRRTIPTSCLERTKRAQHSARMLTKP